MQTVRVMVMVVMMRTVISIHNTLYYHSKRQRIVHFGYTYLLT